MFRSHYTDFLKNTARSLYKSDETENPECFRKATFTALAFYSFAVRHLYYRNRSELADRFIVIRNLYGRKRTVLTRNLWPKISSVFVWPLAVRISLAPNALYVWLFASGQHSQSTPSCYLAPNAFDICLTVGCTFARREQPTRFANVKSRWPTKIIMRKI